jgi:Tfp pilus assembly protein PilV
VSTTASRGAERNPPLRRGRADSGTSFIELLVAVVLLGITIVAVLTAVRATVIGTTLERDHSKAQQWLQSAVGIIENEAFADCNTVILDGPAIQQVYQTAIDYVPATESGAKPPFNFVGATITVQIPDVWDGNQFVLFSEQGLLCFDNKLLRQQRIQIDVTSPNGKVIESVQVVKSDS